MSTERVFQIFRSNPRDNPPRHMREIIAEVRVYSSDM
jgi:hypothetical protein